MARVKIRKEQFGIYFTCILGEIKICNLMKAVSTEVFLRVKWRALNTWKFKHCFGCSYQVRVFVFEMGWK